MAIYQHNKINKGRTTFGRERKTLREGKTPIRERKTPIREGTTPFQEGETLGRGNTIQGRKNTPGRKNTHTGKEHTHTGRNNTISGRGTPPGRGNTIQGRKNTLPQNDQSARSCYLEVEVHAYQRLVNLPRVPKPKILTSRLFLRTTQFLLKSFSLTALACSPCKFTPQVRRVITVVGTSGTSARWNAVKTLK